MSKSKKLAYIVFLLKILEGCAAGMVFPVYVPFLDSFGLTELQINIVNSFYFLGSSILDPFTGNFADRYGRRKLYVFGTLFWVVASFSYASATSFWTFARSEVLAAFGYALKSEALESWIRPLEGRESSHKIISHGEKYARLVSILASVTSGYLASLYGYALSWKIAGLFFICALVLTLIIWLSLPSSRNGVTHTNVSIRRTWIMLLQHPSARKLVVVTMFATFAVMPFNMFWPLIFVDFGLPSKLIGFMAIIVSVPVSVGLHWSGNHKIFSPTKKGLIATYLIIGVPMFFVGKIGGVVGFLVLFTCHELGRGTISNITRTMFSDYMPEDMLSTANSIRSGLSTFGGFLGLIFSGYIAVEFSRLLTWHISAVLMVLLAIYMYKSFK